MAATTGSRYAAMAFATGALGILILLQSPSMVTAQSPDAAEMDFAHNQCKKMDPPTKYRKPGEPVYFSMEGTYHYYYYCKEARATRVDCAPDLVDQICTALARRRFAEA
ncbi:uncharacterized protein LOC144157934 [Haemaphysalis longicornis]